MLVVALWNSSLYWGWAISNKHGTLWVQFYGAITNGSIFYITSFILIPKYFNSRRKSAMVFFSCLLLLTVSCFELVIDHHIGKALQTKSYQGAAELGWLNFIVDGLVYILPINILYFLIAFAFRLPLDRKRMVEHESKLIQQKLETELKFFKTQVHPHTLFNAMNSIYHLVDQAPEKAKQMVLSLSQSMRYHLYESQDKYVLLSKELEYLKNYIALNKIRIEDDVTVDVEIDPYDQNARVAPLLFTPFIENAFKYVSQSIEKNDNIIKIYLKVSGTKIEFQCQNTTLYIENKATKVGGLGLTNVNSRLKLLYGDDCKLTIEDQGRFFKVDLTLPLKYTNE